MDLSVTLVAEVCLIINTECRGTCGRDLASPNAVFAKLILTVFIHRWHNLNLTCHFVKQTASFLVKYLVQVRYTVRTLELRLLDLD